MQLRFDAIDGHLAKSLAPLYVITSDEHLLALETADKIRRAAKTQGFEEREIFTVERSFKWGALLAANQSQSLFGDKNSLTCAFLPASLAKMVVLRYKNTLAIYRRTI